MTKTASCCATDATSIYGIYRVVALRQARVRGAALVREIEEETGFENCARPSQWGVQ